MRWKGFKQQIHFRIIFPLPFSQKEQWDFKIPGRFAIQPGKGLRTRKQH